MNVQRSAARLRQVFFRAYGGPFWTLPILIACFLVTGYAADKVIRGPNAVRILVWFAAAAVLHDFVLFPAYSLLDRAARSLPFRRHLAARPIINYLRIPAALSLLMLLIYAPTILGRGQRAFFAASGLGKADVLLRWLLLSLAFFAASGALYLFRFLLSRHHVKEPQ